ncbi:hypothetical protein MASR1M45_20970 [Candidatus Kapaibacterium sp.]
MMKRVVRRYRDCSIKNPMSKIQKLIDDVFINTSIADLVHDIRISKLTNGFSQNLIEIKKIV